MSTSITIWDGSLCRGDGGTVLRADGGTVRAARDPFPG